ncbi:MAG: hypothetical protein AMXMBFR23_01290 [Chloroflexota bacterium]
MTPPVLRVVGPPGSGKSLLITSLVEALRTRGHRIATLVPRSETTTVIVLSHGGRVTLERPMTFEALLGVVASVDPSVQLVLAEGYDAPGVPAVELRPRGGSALVPDADRFALVESEAFAALFARSGPGETAGLAERIEAELLGVRTSASSGRDDEQTGRLGRWVSRFRRP